MEQSTRTKPLDRYLSPLDVWGMAFGCMVGWGVVAMPGTTFLPVAGPAGTALAMLIGMVIMLIIAANFSYLMGRNSMTGGVYSYTKEAFGRDHAFLTQKSKNSPILFRWRDELPKSITMNACSFLRSMV